jgi:hypothetical protein
VKLENAPIITQTTAKDVKDKAAVIGWLKDSFEAIRRAYPTADWKKPAKLFGQRPHGKHCDGHGKLGRGGVIRGVALPIR